MKLSPYNPNGISSFSTLLFKHTNTYTPAFLLMPYTLISLDYTLLASVFEHRPDRTLSRILEA